MPDYISNALNEIREKLLDISKIKKLGWTPKISPDKGIRQTYQWYQEHMTAKTSQEIYQ